jgi:ABC-type multidrug transport system fused ATPase/permease subunit
LNDEIATSASLEKKYGKTVRSSGGSDYNYEGRYSLIDSESVNVSLNSKIHPDETLHTMVTLSKRAGSDTTSKNGISIMNVTAKWTEDLPENTLTDVNLEVRPGGLVAVIGPVGSGKVSYRYSLGGAVNSAWCTELMLECLCITL